MLREIGYAMVVNRRWQLHVGANMNYVVNWNMVV